MKSQGVSSHLWSGFPVGLRAHGGPWAEAGRVQTDRRPLAKSRQLLGSPCGKQGGRFEKADLKLKLNSHRFLTINLIKI